MKNINILTFMLLLFASLPIRAQIDESMERAMWILNISTQVEWNANNTDNFTIGVLGADNVAQNLRTFSKSTKIKDKPIIVIEYTNHEKIAPSDTPLILYVDRKENISLDEIFERISGTHTLLVTDRAKNLQYTMINFTEEDESDKFFVINDKALKNQNLTLSNKLMKFGGTAEVLRDMYSEIEVELEKEKAKLEEQRRQIKQQIAVLDSLEQQVEIQHKELAEKQEMIDIKEEELLMQAENLDKLIKQTVAQRNELTQNMRQLKQQELAIKTQKDNLLEQQNKIADADKELKHKQLEIKEIDEKLNVSEKTVEKKTKENTVLYIMLIIIAGLTVYSIYAFLKKRKINKLLHEQNVNITTQKEKIQSINEDLSVKSSELEIALSQVNEQNTEIEKKNREVTGSITYAKRIQDAILGATKAITENFADSFIYFNPHSIVSGDFYWFANLKEEGAKVLVAADCTGHGVPGAFMTVIGNNLLDEIVMKERTTDPSLILKNMDARIRLMLKKEEDSDVNDGMDMVVIVFHEDTNKISFSGAKNPVLIFRDNELNDFKGSIHAIGGQEIRTRKSAKSDEKYITHSFDVMQGDMIYSFSDGFQDQMGGPKQRKYMKRRFYDFLAELCQLPADEQLKRIDHEHINWKQHYPQTDDILIIGVRI